MLHQNMGLIGGLLVTRADAVAADGRADDTDIEFFTLFHVSDAAFAHLQSRTPDLDV